MDKYESLKLDNQMCFPFYVVSKEIIRLYTPLLNELDLTYTQYITLLALWQHETMNVKELGKVLYLDSGTLTPLLKKLENKKLISMNKSNDDKRVVLVSLTKEGMNKREEALKIPQELAKQIDMDLDDLINLQNNVHKLMKVLLEKK